MRRRIFTALSKRHLDDQVVLAVSKQAPTCSMRPVYHVTPPRGWVNDPCAPWCDPATGVHHIYFQWVPKQTEWDYEIGWGHAFSKDLLHWKVDELPVFMPSEEYDILGVFTGNMMPTAGRNGELRAVYSCLNRLAEPDRVPKIYTNGQERLALVISNDAGHTWTKDPSNPLSVIPPPEVTGWRDPLVALWPAMSRLTGHDGHFGIVSGGLPSGPTIFLYTVDDLEWTYLGPLFVPETAQTPPHSPWTAHRGWNWECGSFFQLAEKSFFILGAESTYQSILPGDQLSPEAQDRPSKWQLWFSGNLRAAGDGPKMAIDLEGVLDWGCCNYASASNVDDKGRRLIWGWLADDELSKEARASQGWTGAMAMPHEMFIQQITDVISAINTSLDNLPSFQTQEDVDGARTLWTLGQRPLEEVRGARGRGVKLENMQRSLVWELELVANVERAHKVIVKLNFAEGYATIEYTPDQELLVIRRNESTRDRTINTLADHGKHTLFRTRSGLEPLRLHVFYDTSILKVFANDRCVITSRLYAGACNLALEVEGEVQNSKLSIWSQ